MAKSKLLIGCECWAVATETKDWICICPASVSFDKSEAIDGLLEVLDSALGAIPWHNPKATRSSQWAAAKRRGYHLRRFKMVPE